ncbi:MAG: metal-dependent hydrolase [Candidatus Pacebacteria bacterium]|nr:metal-dependent hydrolase [Candidatus Paceibacterota bacterium]
MNPLSHLSYPALFFVLLAKIFHIEYSFFDLLILMFFCVLPDLDLLFFSIFSKQKKEFSFSNLLSIIFASIFPNYYLPFCEFEKSPNHRKWATHLPVVYFPLIILLFFQPNLRLFLIYFGIYSHLILDTLLRGSIMWLYPLSKKEFSFFNKFKNYSNAEYFKFYKKSVFYKLDIVGFIGLLIIFISKLLTRF